MFNEDIRPTLPAERRWSVLNMAALWIGMVVCVPTYMLAGGLIDQGMNWWQAVVTVMLGNIIAMGLALLGWAWVKADGFGPMLSTPSRFVAGGPREGEFWAVFFPSLTAMVGFWATLSLNIPDFTRYARSQRDQVLGQAIGLPAFMTLFSFIGVAVTSATAVIFGETIWDPTVLLGRMGAASPWW